MTNQKVVYEINEIISASLDHEDNRLSIPMINKL